MDTTAPAPDTPTQPGPETVQEPPIGVLLLLEPELDPAPLDGYVPPTPPAPPPHRIATGGNGQPMNPSTRLLLWAGLFLACFLAGWLISKLGRTIERGIEHS